VATPIPRNTAAFTAQELVTVVNGEVTAGVAKDVVGVSTDTRALTEGAVFVAIRGASHDGHDHLAAAAKAGAAIAIVERDVVAPEGLAVVRVASTLDALGALSRGHARKWRALGGRRTVIAITGSAGKTTTRVAVAALLEALSEPGAVLATTGNLNNLVGAPMVLFGLRPEHHLAVVEIGTNAPGEIAALASIVEADIGVITLIAAAHTEKLGSIEGVAFEKGALFRSLRSDGVAIANGDDARVVAALATSPATTRIAYGRADSADVKITARDVDGLVRSRVTITSGSQALTFSTPLLGEAGALASAAAIAVVRALGLAVDSATAERAFAAAEVGGGAGRLVPRELADGLAIIDDSYNANPASMAASIRAATEIAKATDRRLVLALGEMRELGDASAQGHDDVGDAAASSPAAEIITVGGDARRIADRASSRGASARFFSDVAAAAAAVAEIARPRDLVLVKGSRGVATEAIVAALVGRRPSP
jgi:UDP-N-acetylmuramoyl-tripeptide--D-alanyl-D-alanine ligase